MVCTLRPPVRLDGTEQSLGHARQHTDHINAKVFRAHAAPQGGCDNLINALKLLANQQEDGDSPVRMIVPRLLEKNRRKIMDGRRLFIAVDNYTAVMIEDLEKETTSKKVVKPRFTTHFLGAVIREGADERTLRAHEEDVFCAPSPTPRMWKHKSRAAAS